MPKKEHNGPGDVVLVHFDGTPAIYARIEEVRGHARPGWFECDLLFLAHPPQAVTWILEQEQIDGTPFTMGGRPVEIERLAALGEVHAQRVRVLADQRENAPASPSGESSGDEEPGHTAKKPRSVRGRGKKVVSLVPRTRGQDPSS